MWNLVLKVTDVGRSNGYMPLMLKTTFDDDN